MHIEGKQIRLRAVEPEDIELMYRWENDCEVWEVSGTLTPFSHHTLQRFIEEQQFDLWQTRQQRLVIETHEGVAVGLVDLFALDPLHRRAGIGILIAEEEDRRRGYARDAIETLCRYGREMLGLHQLWCNVGSRNIASRALFFGCGFEEVGTMREWLWHPDGWEDQLMLQRILE